MPSVPVAQKQERQNRLAQIDDKFLTTPNGPLSNKKQPYLISFVELCNFLLAELTVRSLGVLAVFVSKM